MFKVQAEGFVSTKLNRSNTVMIEDKPVTYINTSIGSKYKNPHTGDESWDNLRILLKGDIANSFKENVSPRDLVRIEGTLHEKSYKNEAGVTIYYMECTVHKFRKLEIAKKAETPKANSNPLSALPKEVLSTLTKEQLEAIMATAS
jgi:hypothetical protein